MRHKIGYKKLNCTSSHRKAMLSNMVVSVLQHESIKTTLAKAKSLRPFLEKLITKAKKGGGSLHSRRYLLSIIKNQQVVDKLFDDIAKRYENRNGGYVSILKCGFRFGDAAKIAIIRLV